jgi:hypothetical protein
MSVVLLWFGVRLTALLQFTKRLLGDTQNTVCITRGANG